MIKLTHIEVIKDSINHNTIEFFQWLLDNGATLWEEIRYMKIHTEDDHFEFFDIGDHLVIEFENSSDEMLFKLAWL